MRRNPWIVYSDRVPRDVEHEAMLAEQTRRQEVEGLLHERAQVLARREAVAESRPRKRGMIVVDHEGKDTGLRVKNVTLALDGERLEDELRGINEQLKAIDRELKHCGATA